MLIKEQNVIRKQWSPDKIRIGLIYPQTYRVAMTSLAVHLFYFLFNSWENFLCERIFRPLDPQIKPYSLENIKHPKDFDILAISCQFEMDYIYAIELLQKSDIDPDVRERDDDDPLIIIGGPSATANPFPILFTPDVFFLGDFEPIAPEFREALLEKSKKKKIETLANIQGIMAYEYHYTKKGTWTGEKINPVKIRNFSESFYPIKQIIPLNVKGTKNEPVFGKAYYLETDRGCNQRCNFCLIGHCRFPRIGRSLDDLMNIIDNAGKVNDFEKVVIYGSSTAQSGIMVELLDYITSKGYQVSCSSFRADNLDERLLQSLKKGGQKTITIAPETGDEKLRLDLNKNMSDESIFSAIRKAWELDFRQLKLYLIYGFPYEDKETDKKSIDFIQTIRKKYFPRGQISISLNQFISKANTPLQFAPMLGIKKSKEKQRWYKKQIYQITNTIPSFFQPEWAGIQRILSLKGKDTFPLLLKIAEKGNKIGNWKRTLKERKSDLETEMIWKYEIDQELPWDPITHELSKASVIAAYRRYIKNRKNK